MQKGTRTPLGKPTGGNWSPEESILHINALELLAAWYVVKSYCKHLTNTHIQISVDNTTAVAYINHMGGTKNVCNKIAQRIWKWCYETNNWLSCIHLAGKLNVVADRESRTQHDNMEWKLNPSLFSKIAERFGDPEVDLFASRLNFQVPKYFSWKPDPGAEQVDALAQDWQNLNFYAFPPFNMIGKVLNKINRDEAQGVIVVPYWPTQFWFSMFTAMIIKGPFVLFSRDEPTLSHPHRTPEQLPKMRLLAARVSSRHTAAFDFVKQPSDSYHSPGERKPRKSTRAISPNGLVIVTRGGSRHCPPI